MPSNQDPIERAKQRFREVQAIMAEAANVRQEFYDLEAFLSQAHKLFPDAFDVWPLPGMSGTQPNIEVRVSDKLSAEDSTGGAKPVGRLKTSDYAAWILKVHGPLHLRDLVKHMRTEGWTSSKDERTAEKTLFNIMKSHPARFRNKGGNIWDFVGKG